MLSNDKQDKENSTNQQDNKWKFSFVPMEELSLYRLCSLDFPVMYWAPRREEVERIKEIALELHGDKEGLPKILEIGCGSGLLSCLLASTGRLDVIATDRQGEFLDKTIYRHPNLRYENLDADGASEKYKDQGITLVINSWMPPGVNFTPAMRNVEAAGIIYVSEKTGETGVPETRAELLRFHHGAEKLDDLISYRPGKDYERALNWRGPAHWEIVESFKGRTYAESICNSNLIELQIRQGCGDLDRLVEKLGQIYFSSELKYPWEGALEKFKGSLAGPINRLRV